MKKAWHSLFEGFETPVILYFVGMLLLGLGNNFTSTNSIITTILKAFTFTGGLIKTFFPLYMIINVVGKRHEDSVPEIGGVVGYLIFIITTMFIANQNFPEYCYLQISLPLMDMGITALPLRTGFIGAFLVIVITIGIYKISRQRLNYGLLTFINNDAWFIIMNSLLCFLAGVLVCLAYPYAVNILSRAMRFVSNNAANPASMFLYGVMERVMEVCGLQDLLHYNFWFGSYGGIWQDGAVTYAGDVAIWSAQYAQNALRLGTGRYITPYYIINFFVVPAVAIAIYCQFTNKVERRRYAGLIVLAIIVSILAGSLAPLEMLMLVISPMMLILLILVTSSINAVMQMVEIYLGYTYSGGLAFATPGNLLSFLTISTRISNNVMRKIIMIGLIYAAIGFVAVFLYYNVLAEDFLDGKSRRLKIKQFISALGGISNIRIVDGSPFSLSVALYDNAKVNENALLDLGAYRVRELYFCYYVDYGPGSLAICRGIRKELKDYQHCLKYIENK